MSLGLDEWLAFYTALASSSRQTLRLPIAPTLLLNADGTPAALFSNSSGGAVRRRGGGAGLEASVAALVEGADGAYACVERSAAMALLLKREDLSALEQTLAAGGGAGADKGSDEAADFAPFCLQSHVEPARDTRLMAVYMQNEHLSACQAFPCRYSARYRDVAKPAPPSGTDVEEPVADALLAEVKHVMLGIATHLRKKGKRVGGLVCEFVVSERTGELLFHGLHGIHWPGSAPTWATGSGRLGRMQPGDPEGQLTQALVERVMAEKPAMRVFSRVEASASPRSGAAQRGEAVQIEAVQIARPEVSPRQRVDFRREGERVATAVASSARRRAGPTTPLRSQQHPRSPSSGRRGLDRGPRLAAHGSSTGPPARPSSAVAAGPVHRPELVVQMSFQIECLQDALQQTHFRATAAELAAEQATTAHSRELEAARAEIQAMQLNVIALADDAQRGQEAAAELEALTRERDSLLTTTEALNLLCRVQNAREGGVSKI